MEVPPPNSSSSSDNNNSNNNGEDNNNPNGNKKPATFTAFTPAKQNINVKIDNIDINNNKDTESNDIVIKTSGLEKALKKSTNPALFSKSILDREKESDQEVLQEKVASRHVCKAH